MKLGKQVIRFSVTTLEDGKEKEIKRVLRRPRTDENDNIHILYDKKYYPVNYDNDHYLPYIILK
jgi:hypothetical protein